MRLRYQVLLPLLGLFLGREFFTAWRPPSSNIQVIRVLDGDTVIVDWLGKPLTLRLAGIDAPEKGQPTRIGNLDAGKIAGECLKKTLVGHEWKLLWKGRDIYHRVLGDLESQGHSLSLSLVEQGCVSVYPFLNDFSREERATLKRTLGQAQRAWRGLWKYGGFQRPYNWRKFQKTIRAPVATE